MAECLEYEDHKNDYVNLFGRPPELAPNDHLVVKRFIWPSPESPPSDTPAPVTVDKVQATIPANAVQLIFCDNERPSFWPQQYLLDFVTLFNKFGVPSCFILEKTLSHTHSFGVKQDGNNYDYWYRFLNKSIEFRRNAAGLPVDFPLGRVEKAKVPGAEPTWSPGADPTWNQASFYMRYSPTTSTATLFPGNVAKVLQNPYVILLPILHHFFETITHLQYDVLDVFKNGAEKSIFRYAAMRNQDDLEQLDFAYLHNIATHTIHLVEGMDAIIDAIGMIYHQHSKFMTDIAGDNLRAVVSLEVERGLHYLRGLFIGLRIRLTSLDKRVTNAIQLTFNLVTEMDSLASQEDNASMNVIAVVTLLFLPATTVMSFFGSQLISFDPDKSKEGSGGLIMSGMWWLYLAATIPITAGTLLGWLWQTKRKSRKILMRRQKRTMLNLMEKGT